ncbi:MAG TPA: hypothetical protein VLG13_03345 [Patescibacteria group bacterium]|nr:hypothetical protein [Patescibacteria group bacterium]
MNKLTELHGTKLGLFTFAIIEIAIAYGFASLAIDRGNLWFYILTLIFFVGTLQNLVKLIGKFVHGNKKTA